MASFLLLLVCLMLGMLVAHRAHPPQELARSLNWWILHISLPAIVLENIPRLEFDWSLWFLAVSMWLMFALSWLVFNFIGRRFNWPRETIGAAVLASALCNSGFVGFPMIEALLGRDMLTYAVTLDQLGSFMNVSIGGTLVVAIYSGGQADRRTILRKIIRFPPFIALLAALIVALTPGWPSVVEEVLGRIGSTIAPLALFSVGLQLRLTISAHRVAPLISVLCWKLGMMPLMVLGMGLLFDIHPPILTVTVLESAMAPMLTVAVLAEQDNLDTQSANMMVGVGVLLSFITVPLWNLLF